MDALQQHALLRRLPHTPYPGLRPFLDHEDMLMHGRRTQVAEIVRRLGRGAFAGDDERLPRVLAEPGHDAEGRTLSMSAQTSLMAVGAPAVPLTRFVAVIGGSGSGKSSLIRAGVVPYLRQFGIPEVGDLWEPVVFTPGTNFAAGDAGDAPAGTETPITRLAWRFESTLRGHPDPARREAIAELLRRPGGLGRAIDTYGPEIDLPDGVDAAKACVLVVIDQFEELFHPSNRDVADARQLIERVIDHFHQSRAGTGSTRCFLAITMRSEHLNDCAGFLGLPEAINAGAFLVSRLDDAAVREVIEKPAQRFLRLRQRERRGSDATALPASVRFDPSVVERLVQDTRAIAHDPDHLPLLQHLLARLWQRALRREQRAADEVPAELQWADLCSAALADDAPTAPPANDDNLLRLALERWAEHEFAQHPPGQQALLTDVLRRLVYKDPTSGTYNQQRLYVATHPAGADALSALLGGRWTRSVNYLYWDDDNPGRITLKVSHESFIRGWQRLRTLADVGATQFNRVLELLGACRDWLAQGQSDADLMEERLLRRLKDAGLGPVFLPPPKPVRGMRRLLAPKAAVASSSLPSILASRTADEAWAEWMGWLPATPRGSEFAGLSFAQVADYATRSDLFRSHEAEREAASRRKWVAALVVCGGVFFATSVGFNLLVQGPVVHRAAKYFQSAIAANQVRAGTQWPEPGGGASGLATLLDAAALLEEGRTGEGVRFSAISDRVLDDPWSPGRSLALHQVLPLAGSAIEPLVNGRLRDALTHGLWATNPTPPLGDAARMVDGSGNPAQFHANCGGQPGLLLPVEGDREASQTRRAVFAALGHVGRASAQHDNGVLFAATLLGGGQCQLHQQIEALPQQTEPVLLFDASLSHLLLVKQAETAGHAPSVALHRLTWDNPDSGESARLSAPLASFGSAQLARAVREQARQPIGMARATWRAPGGRVLGVGAAAWRIVVDGAQRLVPNPQTSELAPVAAARDNDGCEPVRQALMTELTDGSTAITTVKVHRVTDHCLAILRERPRANAGISRDTVTLRAYTLHAAQQQQSPQPQAKASGESEETSLYAPRLLATLPFGQLPADVDDFLVGRSGTRWDGWLVLMRPPDARNPAPRWLGVPWSTGALLRLGREVLEEHRRYAANDSKTATAPSP